MPSKVSAVVRWLPLFEHGVYFYVANRNVILALAFSKEFKHCMRCARVGESKI